MGWPWPYGHPLWDYIPTNCCTKETLDGAINNILNEKYFISFHFIGLVTSRISSGLRCVALHVNVGAEYSSLFCRISFFVDVS